MQASVYILFVGKAKVHWDESRTTSSDGNTSTYKLYFRGHQQYLDSRTNVFGEGELPVGTYTYSFCIPLPLECPTSCEEKYGKIFYELSLVIDRSWRFNNEFKRSVTVLETYNLNNYPVMKIPLKCEDIKEFCCWPCSTGPIVLTLTLPFGGYAPGQNLNYIVQINNQSNGYDLEGIVISLIQTIKFQASTPHDKSKTRKNTLYSKRTALRVGHLSKRLVNDSFKIPPTLPSTQNYCIIDVSYKIKMVIEPEGCNGSSEIETPITIGTIALDQTAVVPNNVAIRIPVNPDPTAVVTADLPPSYDSCTLPLLEQATTISDKFENTDADEHSPTDDFISRSVPSASLEDELQVATASDRDNSNPTNKNIRHK